MLVCIRSKLDIEMAISDIREGAEREEEDPGSCNCRQAARELENERLKLNNGLLLAVGCRENVF